jgi:hypothetical protein
MWEDRLCDEGFISFALQHYENPQCESLGEFYEDLDRIKYLKRLMNRTDGDLAQRNRLILNHLIIITNVFGIKAGNRILFYRMEEKYHRYLKTYLHFLNVLAKEIPEAALSGMEMDDALLGELRKI